MYTVNVTRDTGASSGIDATTGYPSGDLLWAITQANANTNPAGSVIGFDPSDFSSPRTITLKRDTETLREGWAGSDRWSWGRACDGRRRRQWQRVRGRKRGHGDDLGSDDQRSLGDVAPVACRTTARRRSRTAPSAEIPPSVMAAAWSTPARSRSRTARSATTRATRGGGLWNDAKATLDGCDFTGNGLASSAAACPIPTGTASTLRLQLQRQLGERLRRGNRR